MNSMTRRCPDWIDPTIPLIFVCAWHTPRAEMDAMNLAHLPGTFTHGICASCQARLNAELDAQEAA